MDSLNTKICGIVVHGDKRGRDLGFPTANLQLTSNADHKFGVYACRVAILEGDYTGQYKGCASIGCRPMFGRNAPNLEVYIINFDGNLYGMSISVELIEFLRPELVFDCVTSLIDAISRDVVKTKMVLSEDA